ncbi:hypothetical protein RJ640_029908 [Escallonia rubra]|uniref:Uncharacterized protein n=1 Tax=Escallonia rubra TaxID=112253 RepID=A0AA88U9L8_9ASTE|nr:hypothetical protein RJ640_029908 [Escallonia rubra]
MAISLLPGVKKKRKTGANGQESGAATKSVTLSCCNSMASESSLEVLRLDGNQLSGSLPDFTILSSLRELRLNRNQLSGSFPEHFGQTSSLTHLDLSENRISGSLPELTSFLSLKELHLTNSKISGKLTESVGQLSMLEFLDASSNSLEGVISEAHLSNLSMLRDLDLSYNSMDLKFSADWAPAFQLDTIKLASCKLGPSFPKWLQTQNNFSVLDISGAGILGTVPDWFWNLSPRLSDINLSNNQIHGMIPNILLTFAPFLKIDFSSNNFSGPILSVPFDVSALNLAKNWKGREVEFRNTLGLIKILDLSSNKLSGEIPSEITNLAGLVGLNLSRNSLSGPVAPKIGQLRWLYFLDSSRNQLIGEIPKSLSQVSNLGFLDLSDNNLSWQIPSSTQLQSFMLLHTWGILDFLGLHLRNHAQETKYLDNQSVMLAIKTMIRL